MDARTLCLAVLSYGDASGYEIKKSLEEAPFSHFQDTGFGSIYPALSRLTNEGLVSGRALLQEKRPNKIVYTITDVGREALVDALMEPPAPDKFRSDFLFVLFLGHLLPGEHLLNVVDERIKYYEERIEQMSHCALDERPLGQQMAHGMGLALYQAALQYLKESRPRLAAGDGSVHPMVAE